MFNASDLPLVTYVLELRQLLALVRQVPEFTFQLETVPGQVIPRMNLARIAEREATGHTYQLLAGETHRRMRLLVAAIHNSMVQASVDGKLGPMHSIETCQLLEAGLGVKTLVEKASELSNIWSLSLLVDNYALQLGAFNNYRR